MTPTELAAVIKRANDVVVFTGAGMSTESGLPDFRSNKNSLWQKFNPDELANVEALLNNEEEFTAFYRHRLADITKHEPHRGHDILAQWEASGLIRGIITQNVDGFHHDAGSQCVQELHGTFRTFHCHICEKEQTREAYLAGETTCSCGGTFRPGIVLFGEMLPEQPFEKADELTKAADVFIVLGSSLSVTPANMFPLMAKEHGATLIIINWEPTDLDRHANAVIHETPIQKLLIETDEALKQITLD